MGVKLIKTEDGSHSLYVPELEEHYHSTKGAVQESLHVFINAGLEKISEKTSQVRVFEVGFGTGLNAILTSIAAIKQNMNIHYTSIETFPIPEMVYKDLNFCELLGDEYQEDFQKMHQQEWGMYNEINSAFKLKKLEVSFQDYQTSENFNLIYFDAFGPDKQPEMWTQDLFDKCYQMLDNDGVLVTYSAKGAVRRALKASGFEVNRLPGPPGKREMLRGIKKS